MPVILWQIVDAYARPLAHHRINAQTGGLGTASPPPLPCPSSALAGLCTPSIVAREHDHASRDHDHGSSRCDKCTVAAVTRVRGGRELALDTTDALLYVLSSVDLWLSRSVSLTLSFTSCPLLTSTSTTLPLVAMTYE